MLENYPFCPAAEDGEEQGIEKSLRPRTLDEFIGQRRVAANLQLAIEAARAREEVLDHVLLSGMPGLGKTTLSYLIAAAFGVRPILVSGPNLERGKDVVGLLTQLHRGDILFIDEIHRMSAQAEEYLYSAMEDFRVDVMLDRGPDARSVCIHLEPFTMIGATTREGLLTGPLRDRFQIVEKLEFYSDEELDQIILRSAGLLGCAIDPEASIYLAQRCRGTPRYANRFLRRIRDVAQSRAGWSSGEPLRIDLEAVSEGLDRLGVDAQGLDRIDRKILEILITHGDQPVGLKTIAVSVGEEERTLEDVYEPHLIRKGLVLKTPRGRRATSQARKLYGGRSLGDGWLNLNL
ncbi:MAG: Holliday junction branch migration DNA helicase RuvB [Planctomycetes bacterium]|nr:Holliday junction branch migration DNA helicase RuvB [Planctomycetota bacterium]